MTTAKTIAETLQRAVALHIAGRTAEAEKLYDKVLQLQSTNADGLNLKAIIAGGNGRAEEALGLFDRAAAASPRFAEAHFNKGNLLLELGRLEDAVSAYARAIALHPNHANARLNAGLAFDRLGQRDAAIGAFRSMALVCPEDARGHYNLGVCLTEVLPKTGIEKQDRLATEAFAALQKARALDPGNAAIPYALGNLLAQRGDHAGAIAQVKQAIALRPDWPDAWNNLGNHLDAAGDRAGAMAALDRALALDPNLVGAIVNRGMARLSLGHLDGWDGYARRSEDSRFPFTRRDWPWRPWLGEDLAGKSILLWSDQGIGDQVLYGSMIPAIAARAGACTVECPARLVNLYRRSFPTVEIVARDAGENAGDTALHRRTFDFHCSVLDAGRWLRRSFSAFPNRGAYLQPDINEVAAFRQSYRASGKLAVGLSWRSANPHFGLEKSITLAGFAPLFDLPDVTFVNLQYGDTVADIASLGLQAGQIRTDPTVDSLQDLDRFAAQVASLDLVITVSNSTAHFAGALGVPTWVFVPDGRKRLWYWFDEGLFSPWYRSVRIFRHPAEILVGRIGQLLPSLGLRPPKHGPDC